VDHHIVLHGSKKCFTYSGCSDGVEYSTQPSNTSTFEKIQVQ